MSDDLSRLAADLRADGEQILATARPVVAKGALNIKNAWRQSATGLRHAKRYPYSIGYDVDLGVTGVRAVIGPDKAKPQGALGNLIEFGSPNNAPHNDGGRALQAEEPRFVEALGAVVGRKLSR